MLKHASPYQIDILREALNNLVEERKYNHATDDDIGWAYEMISKGYINYLTKIMEYGLKSTSFYPTIIISEQDYVELIDRFHQDALRKSLSNDMSHGGVVLTCTDIHGNPKKFKGLRIGIVVVTDVDKILTNEIMSLCEKATYQHSLSTGRGVKVLAPTELGLTERALIDMHERISSGSAWTLLWSLFSKHAKLKSDIKYGLKHNYLAWENV